MSEEQNTDTIGALKNRLANMLINTVSLSETINILRDFCVKRGEELVDNASEEQLENIKKQVNDYEDSIKQQQEVEQQASAADPSGPVSGPASGPTAGPEIVSDPSGPSGTSGGCQAGC